jgi:cytochrome c biogenesis protein CcmG, thiol:disulfide interchange protein DsbE
MSTRPRTTPPSSSSNSGLYWTLGGVALVIVGIFAVALFVRGGEGAGADVDQTADVTVEGQALPMFPGESPVADPSTDPATGLEAPTLRGVSFDGTPVEVTGDGTSRLVVFVAHWCPHCQREVPKLQDLVEAGEVPDGIEIVAVSTSVDARQPNYPPSRWLLDREGWTSPVLLDDADSSAARSYGLTSFPYGVYLDGDNRVVARTAGALEADVVRQLLDVTAGAGA